jgi:hypothetical protein
MVRIKIDEIFEKLESNFHNALISAVQEVFPEANFDIDELFEAFKRAIRRKCNIWETVSDNYVEID